MNSVPQGKQQAHRVVVTGCATDMSPGDGGQCDERGRRVGVHSDDDATTHEGTGVGAAGVGRSVADGADVIVVGAGLAGLVATAELADAGRTVILVDQENEANLGGQAFWSFGGLFFVDSPEQRRMGVHDSFDLAWQDWLGTAGFDRDRADRWPRRWARAYVEFAAGEKRAWLHAQGVRWFPVVGWAERGGYGADGPGNSVPRFHITWGTGPGVVEPFARRVRAAADRGLVSFRFRHQVDGLTTTGGQVDGVRGTVLEPSDTARGVASSRRAVGDFELRAQAVVVTSGGIGGNQDLVRAAWPERLGTAPAHLLTGVPAHVDGRMLGITEQAGASVVNRDRMWHYTEGITNFDPIWPGHGIRILPGPSSLWFDATGHLLPPPLYPGFDTLGTLTHLQRTGHAHSWFILTQKIIEKEFALSGSEQNPDLTGKDLRLLLSRIRPGAPGPVEAFKRRGVDFVVRDDLRSLVDGMNALTDTPLLSFADIERQVLARDREMANPYTKDLQIAALRGARRYRGDRMIRVAAPHRLLDPKAGPLIAVKLHLLTRKSLGGLETDLDGRVLRPDGEPLPGAYAAGEVAGFGGGGMHGYRSLEGTFLGGCLFSGRQAGRAAARAVG
jgi:predicted oxidoreductase